MKNYGNEQNIRKEELFLITGTLKTPAYGLFVSHRHSDTHVHFNVSSSRKRGRPWGGFSFDQFPVSGGSAGPSYQENVPAGPKYATKVSVMKVKHSKDQHDAVLLARLRFTPGVDEPTSL